MNEEKNDQQALRREAMQIAIQLPRELARARAVLRYAQDLVLYEASGRVAPACAAACNVVPIGLATSSGGNST